MKTKVVLQSNSTRIEFDAINNIIFGSYTDPNTFQQRWNDVEVQSDLKIGLSLTEIYQISISNDYIMINIEGMITQAEYQGFKGSSVVHTKLTIHPFKVIHGKPKQQKDPIAAYNAAMGVIGRKF